MAGPLHRVSWFIPRGFGVEGFDRMEEQFTSIHAAADLFTATYPDKLIHTYCDYEEDGWTVSMAMADPSSAMILKLMVRI